MSSIQKRGDKWRAFVLIDGKRESQTFRLKKEAVAWATEREESGEATPGSKSRKKEETVII